MKEKLIGQVGKFRSSKGYAYQCEVVDVDGDLLRIHYVRDGKLIRGVWIARRSFRSDGNPRK